jgi:hypothetical protein
MWDRSYIPTVATATSAAHEPQVASSYAERAHVGANGEHNTLMRMLATLPAGVGLLLH